MPNRIVRADDPVIAADELVRMRAENQSKVARIDKFLEKYGRIIVTVVLFISTWLMGHVIGPIRQIPSMVDSVQVLEKRHQRTDSLYVGIIYRLDHADADRSKMVDILGALAALQCEQFTPREKLTSTLCRKITIGTIGGELP